VIDSELRARLRCPGKEHASPSHLSEGSIELVARASSRTLDHIVCEWSDLRSSMERGTVLYVDGLETGETSTSNVVVSLIVVVRLS
jgi:hypothetical protein